MRTDSGRRMWALAALVGLLALGIGSSAAYFTDAISYAQRFTAAIPIPPTLPAPPECAGTAFSEVIVGTSADDTITAGNGGALVFGLGGNDTITGGNAKDCLVGGDGNDALYGGNGKDVLLGGEGNDTLYGDDDGDVLEGGNGKDLLNGGGGIDTCFGTTRDTFVSCEPTSTGGSSDPVAAPDPGADVSLTPDPGPTPSTSAATRPKRPRSRASTSSSTTPRGA